MPILQTTDLKKYYGEEPNITKALDGVSLSVEQGEFVAIVGTSGSGKSTLLNMIGGLDRPSAGHLIVDGKNLFKLSDRELVDYKRRTVGFVWQNNARNLVPYLTAWQNVQMPMLFDKGAKKKQRALELLEMVGLAHKKNSRLAQLSGGEQQRIAVAIALSNRPKLLLADEPTGALDSKTGHMVMDLFHRLHEEQGKTIVLITHSQELATETQRIVTLLDGEIVGDNRGGEH